jgi:vancomycin resistance protein YoaR
MTSLAQTLKQYFDTATESDSALKAVYAESKLDECGKYIIRQAKKLATEDNMAMVESSVVFKWARDFFYGDTEEERSKPETQTGAEKRIKDEIEIEAKSATIIKKKPKKQTKAEANGWGWFQGSLFDDLPEASQ